MKILVTDPLSPEGIKILKEEGFEIDEAGKLTTDALVEKIKGYDGLIVRSGTKVTRPVIEAADKLKVIGRAGVGLDNVELNPATEKGIIVMNSPEGNTISTAEHSFALILSLMRNIPEAHLSVKEGKWEKKGFTGTELYRKIIGIIGFGRIGQRVAQYARAFDMEVLVCDPFISEEKAIAGGVSLVDLETLVKTADLITLHMPITAETKGIVGAKEISLMKPTAFIVNCARGGLIDEKALDEALASGKIKGAALDVFENEPPVENPLLKHRNLIVTPHLGASTREAQDRVALDICRQISDYLKRGVITNAANLPSVSEKMLSFLKPYLNLCEKLGLFLAQAVPGRFNRVQLEYYGEVAEMDLSPLQHGFLNGLLRPSQGAGVNYINAPLLTRERGIKFSESKSTEALEFANIITATVSGNNTSFSVSGTIFGKKEPRLVKIDGYLVDAMPDGFILFCQNEDKPGIVGKIGTILAECQINIAGMTLGRKEKGGPAITILNVDASVPEETLDLIKNIKEVNSVKLIKL
ncbi:MAG: phosphoglycerate dehydrogenase [Candidatus Omnitrophota bacterium]